MIPFQCQDIELYSRAQTGLTAQFPEREEEKNPI